jgi:hypothetical protein
MFVSSSLLIIIGTRHIGCKFLQNRTFHRFVYVLEFIYVANRIRFWFTRADESMDNCFDERWELMFIPHEARYCTVVEFLRSISWKKVNSLWRPVASNRRTRCVLCALNKNRTNTWNRIYASALLEHIDVHDPIGQLDSIALAQDNLLLFASENSIGINMRMNVSSIIRTCWLSDCCKP